MKKFIIIALLCMNMFSSFCKETESVNVEVYHINYGWYTIAPFNEKTVLSCSTSEEFEISNGMYDTIKTLLKKREEIKEVNIITEFDLSFLDEENYMEPAEKKNNSKNNIQKRPITDFDINVRYVIKFNANGQETKLLIGRNDSMIGLDEKFYKIPTENFYELLKIFMDLVE